MTNTRRKNSIRVLMCIATLALFTALFALFTATPTYASAATTPRYAVPFDYTCYYQYNTSTTVNSSGNGTTSATVTNSAGGSTTISVAMYGSSSSGSGTLSGAIASSTVNIVLTSGYKWHAMKVTNSSGAEVGSSSSTTLTLSGLSDGTYYFTSSETGTGWNPNPRAYARYYTNISFSFKVDSTKPTISGASTSTTGKYVKGSFTVYASDSMSGIKALYYKTPNSSYYQSTTSTSKNFPSGSANGLYSFYAVDNAGNQSSTYYVVYDSTAPTGVIRSSSGTTLTSQYTNSAFYYTATDASSGISYLQYKTPSSSSWLTYTSGTNIPATSANGKYTFRAVDKAGNTSEEKSIYLDTTKPVGTLYGGTSTIASGGSTNASYVKFLASDTLSGVKSIFVKTPGTVTYFTYTSGSQLSEEGTYSFYCTDNAGNTSSSYTITLDKSAPTLSTSIGSFYETTSQSFVVAASDESSVRLYYKTPSMSAYSLATGSSYTVNTSAADGRYYFYAEDVLGNRSSTVWVELSVEVPVITVTKSSSDNSHQITWDGNDYTVTVDGAAYSKGDWIQEEGHHTVVATNRAGRSTTKTFTVDHYYVATTSTEPTCTGNGYTIYKCVHCGNTYNSDIVDATGHVFEDTVTGTSCTEGGYITHTCKVCGYTYVSNQTEPLGHSYESVVTEPTCTTGGYTTHTCTRCGHTYTSDVTAAVGHRYEKVVTAPTCTSGGYTKYSCKVCDFNYTSDYTAALGHDYVETVVDASCGVEGYTLHKCSRCEDEYKSDYTPAKAHVYIEEATAPTCTEEGGVNHVCMVCGYKYVTDAVPAIGHNYVSQVVLYATCEMGGEREFTCDRCGDHYVKEIPATGHKYELLEEREIDGTLKRVYGCSVCGESYVEEVGVQYEEVSNFVVYLFDEYSPYMIWVFLATAGVWSIAMGVAMIVAHKNDDKEKAKKMLVNYLIGLVVIFGILVACPYLVKGIAVLVT